MLSVLKNRTYRHLFFAQIVALSGTGLATVALSLLAFQLAEDSAALVLGTALTIKMVDRVSFEKLRSQADLSIRESYLSMGWGNTRTVGLITPCVWSKARTFVKQSSSFTNQRKSVL